MSTRSSDMRSPVTLIRIILAALIVAMSAQVLSAQYAEPINHGGFYLGPRLGIPFVFGFRGRYVAANDDGPVFYADGDLATSVLFNTVSIGCGVYQLGNVLYVGGKYHTLSTLLVDDPGATIPLFSLEVGASVSLGKRKNWLLLIDAGPIINPITVRINSLTDQEYQGGVLPNVTLSLVGRLF